MMQNYRCHKVVEAGEISSRGYDDAYHVTLKDGSHEYIPFRIWQMINEDQAKGNPFGYLVRYDDGAYLSYSPKRVFEKGYSLEP